MSSTDLFSTVLNCVYRYLGIPLYLTANVGFALTASIFSQRQWRKNVCVFYFLVSLLLDFINVNNTLLGNIFSHGFGIQLQNVNTILCRVFNYVTLLCETLSSTLLVLASIDRLLISSQSVETRLYSSRRLAYFSLGISIVFWSLFFSHVLVKYGIYQFSPFISVCLFEPTGFYPNFVAYSLLLIAVGLFFPMIILSIWSFRNVRRIRLIPRQQRPTIRTMHKKDLQLLRCLFAKDIIHIACNAFIVGATIYQIIPKPQAPTPEEQAWTFFLFDLAMFIQLLPYCVSFAIYATISRAFRQDLQRAVWKACGKTLVISALA